jgi:serine/threonine-protein kinase
MIQTGDLLKERYRILRPIGQGGMGSVYLADDVVLAGRQCALKVVTIEPYASKESIAQAKEQFLREASVLARLDHPNLPKVSDFFIYQDADILVMDYVPGEDLKTLMDEAVSINEFLPLEEVLKWTRQLVDALSYLHQQNPPIVHRDIKPSNIKLTPSGVIKLVDFGLVKLLAPDERTITVVQGRGTVYYTPLEQYGGDNGHTDARSDVYSLAATVYHLLTNQAPPEAKVRFVNREKLIPMRAINPEVTQRIEKATEWALSLHPTERPESIIQFRKALFEGIFPAENGRNVFVPQSSTEWMEKALSDRLQLLLAITAGLLMLMGVMATLLR